MIHTFSAAYGSFPKIVHVLGHKTNLNKKTEVTEWFSIFADWDGMKLEINIKRNHTNTWKLNCTVQRNRSLTKSEKKFTISKNEKERKLQLTRSLGCIQGSSRSKLRKHKNLQSYEISQINNLIMYFKVTEKKITSQTKI